MKILIFGATGMVGQGVLRESVLATDVDEVLVVGRSSLGKGHAKLRELIVPDLTDLSAIRDELRGFDACFFCLGVSVAGMSEAAYRKVTYDLTLSVAGTLAEVNPQMIFIYVSGEGTDSTESSRAVWKRIKGATENALMRLPLRAFMFRPGIIQPTNGIKSKTPLYRIVYVVATPLLGIGRRFAPKWFTANDLVGQAMLALARNPGSEHIFNTEAINSLAAGPDGSAH